jgi:hypothetical protein
MLLTLLMATSSATLFAGAVLAARQGHAAVGALQEKKMKFMSFVIAPHRDDVMRQQCTRGPESSVVGQ